MGACQPITLMSDWCDHKEALTPNLSKFIGLWEIYSGSVLMMHKIWCFNTTLNHKTVLFTDNKTYRVSYLGYLYCQKVLCINKPLTDYLILLHKIVGYEQNKEVHCIGNTRGQWWRVHISFCSRNISEKKGYNSLPISSEPYVPKKNPRFLPRWPI